MLRAVLDSDPDVDAVFGTLGFFSPERENDPPERMYLNAAGFRVEDASGCGLQVNNVGGCHAVAVRNGLVYHSLKTYSLTKTRSVIHSLWFYTKNMEHKLLECSQTVTQILAERCVCVSCASAFASP